MYYNLEKKRKKSASKIIFTVLRQITYTKLFIKYSSGNYSYDKISINNLVFNESSRIVSRFKDFLIYDDDTEFLRRLYPLKESRPRLKKILTFYETYSKIFPNYLVLKENKFLYRNIRKKQKMIDAFNEIRREEEENRKKIKQINKEDDNNKLFTSKIREDIKCYQNENSFKSYFKNSFETEDCNQNSISISISLLNRKQFQDFCNDENKNNQKHLMESFITTEMNGSLACIVNTLNDNKIYVKDLSQILKVNTKQIEEKKNEKKIGTTNKKNDNKKKLDKNKHSITNTNRLNNRKQQLFKQSNLNNINKIKKVKDFSKYILTPEKKIELDKNLLTSSNGVSNKSRKNKHIATSSSVLNTNNTNNQDKNRVTTYNSSINTIINSNNNFLIIKNINSNKSIKKNHESKEPNIELKKHFYKTNSNFNKNNLKNTKNNNIIKEKSAKISIDKNNDKKKSSNKLIKHIKRKFASKDFSSKNNNLYTQFRRNLYPKNNFVTKGRVKSQEIYIYDENNYKGKTYKNKFLYENNPNLITADTKSNELENKKKLNEDKITINVRDIIKKENLKDYNTNIFLTNKKPKETITNFNLLTEIKTDSKNLNIHNIIDNKIVNKENITANIITNITKNNSKKNTDNKNTCKQKTERVIKKKFVKQYQKIKTKQEINRINKKTRTKNKLNSIDNCTKNKIRKIRKNKHEYLLKSSDNVFDSSNTLDKKNKYNSISASSSSLIKKIMEKKLTCNFSDIHMKSCQRKIFQLKSQMDHINTLNLNNTHTKNFKCVSQKQVKQKEYKSFLLKNRLKKSHDLKQETLKILSLKILEKINKRHPKRFKGSTDNSTSKLNTNIIDEKEYENWYKTPVVKNKKIEIYKQYFTNRSSMHIYENEIKSARNKKLEANMTIKVNRKMIGKKNNTTNRKINNK